MPTTKCTLRSDPSADGLLYWHLWDAQRRSVAPAFDYLIEAVRTKGYGKSTVEARAFALKKWYSFLHSHGIQDIEATDDTLIEFRSDQQKHFAPNASGDEQARKRTINLDLRMIYKYYVWLQKHSVYSARRRLIGPHTAQITSTLLGEQHLNAYRKRRTDYPVVFRDAGERDRHRSSYVLDEADRAAIHEFFHTHASPDVALRTTLIFDLAWEVGLRRASILSLLVSDFDKARSKPAKDFFNVCPRVQKFGYSKHFPVPLYLISRIIEYIDNERKDIIAATHSTADELFVSSTTGRPLSPKAVTCDFNHAIKSVGLPARTGLHGGRHAFSNNFVRRELAARRELTLDTSADAVAHALAEALGHESISSQAAYLTNLRSIVRDSTAFHYAMENARLASENAELRAALYQEKKYGG